ETLSLALVESNPNDDLSYKLWVNALEAQGGQTTESIEKTLTDAAKKYNSVTASLVLVEYFFRQNLFDRAREVLKAARDQAPDLSKLNDIEAAIAYQEARTAFGDKNYAVAREKLVNALLKQPDNVLLNQFLIRLEIQDSNFREAEKLLSRLKVSQKYGALLSELRGELAAAQGDYTTAESLFTTAWEADRTDAVAHKLYRVIKAQGKPVMGFLSDWKARNGSFAADLFIASEYLDQADYERAAQLYEKLSQNRPDHPMVLNNLAWAYHKMKDKRAVAVARKAVEIAGDSAPILDTLGVILLAEGKDQEALQLLIKANELAPEAEDIKTHLEQARAQN
ncbi:MAG: tetratricopeptide repeat protein, partial [Gammaproteobacteria bacterium]